MNRKRKCIYLLVIMYMMTMMFWAGCIAYEAADGSTKYKLIPGMGDKIEEGGKGALSLLTVLAPFLGPIGGAAVGAVGTGLTIFKKVRPKLEAGKTKYELANAVAGITVEAIEQIKVDHPKVWEAMVDKLRKECEESGIDTKIVKNFIRGLRGLPDKQ